MGDKLDEGSGEGVKLTGSGFGFTDDFRNGVFHCWGEVGEGNDGWSA